MLIGYASCSTATQDLTAQHDGLTALGVKANRIYVDHGLTGRNRDRPGTDPDCAKPSPPAALVTPSWSPSSTAWPAPFPTPATLQKSSLPPK
jgi:Resolvase, N terminal domain